MTDRRTLGHNCTMEKRRHRSRVSAFAVLLTSIFAGIYGFQQLAFSVHEVAHRVQKLQKTGASTFEDPGCGICLAYRLPVAAGIVVSSVVPEFFPQTVRLREYSSQLDGLSDLSIQARAPPCSLLSC